MIPNIFLDPDYQTRQLLNKWQKQKEFKKEQWIKFFKNLLISIPYYVIVVAILLLLFKLIMPSIIFNWYFVFGMALILGSYWSDKEAVKHTQEKIDKYNQNEKIARTQ